MASYPANFLPIVEAFEKTVAKLAPEVRTLATDEALSSVDEDEADRIYQLADEAERRVERLCRNALADGPLVPWVNTGIRMEILSNREAFRPEALGIPGFEPSTHHLTSPGPNDDREVFIERKNFEGWLNGFGTAPQETEPEAEPAAAPEAEPAMPVAPAAVATAKPAAEPAKGTPDLVVQATAKETPGPRVEAEPVPPMVTPIRPKSHAGAKPMTDWNLFYNYLDEVVADNGREFRDDDPEFNCKARLAEAGHKFFEQNKKRLKLKKKPADSTIRLHVNKYLEQPDLRR